MIRSYATPVTKDDCFSTPEAKEYNDRVFKLLVLSNWILELLLLDRHCGCSIGRLHTSEGVDGSSR